MPPRSEQMVNWNTFTSGLLMRWIWGAGRCEFPFNLQHRRIIDPDSLGSYTFTKHTTQLWIEIENEGFFKSHNKTAFWNKCLPVSLSCMSCIGQLLQRKKSILLLLSDSPYIKQLVIAYALSPELCIISLNEMYMNLSSDLHNLFLLVLKSYLCMHQISSV